MGKSRARRGIRVRIKQKLPSDIPQAVQDTSEQPAPQTTQQFAKKTARNIENVRTERKKLGVEWKGSAGYDRRKDNIVLMSAYLYNHTAERCAWDSLRMRPAEGYLQIRPTSRVRVAVSQVMDEDGPLVVLESILPNSAPRSVQTNDAIDDMPSAQWICGDESDSQPGKDDQENDRFYDDDICDYMTEDEMSAWLLDEWMQTDYAIAKFGGRREIMPGTFELLDDEDEDNFEDDMADFTNWLEQG
ncbi:hypothetical protein EUX98_g9409 [Antrodiella citrinella]|uniref:Uncharacterized protein n=1 Tax=Antrodiella citrinella TaxID=2447956 RepID=A0A4S4LTM2_9APHY|nr:hypothetical protein EUX98_g9409 [Antrodiella citrinella]